MCLSLSSLIGTHLDHARWLASVYDTNDPTEISTTTGDVTELHKRRGLISRRRAVAT